MSDLTIAMVLHLAALVLIIAEVFIPSFGMLTIVAFSALAGSWFYLLAAAPDWLIPIVVVGDLILFPIVIWCCLKLLNKSALSNKEVLSSDDGYRIDHQLSPELLGRKAKVVRTLRPSGEIELDGLLMEALSDGNFIDKGRCVEILRIDENKIIVGLTTTPMP